MYKFKYGVNCSLEDTPDNAPVILRGGIENIARDAAKIGYDALELFMRSPRQYDGKHMKRVANENGIAFCAIATGMEYRLNKLCLISDDGAVRRAAIDRLKEHIELAAELGCLVVVGQMRGDIPDFARYQFYEDYLTQALTELNAYAGKAGVPLVVEAIIRYISNYLTSVPETADYLGKLGLPNVGLHIDSHLMNVEDRNIAASTRYGAKILQYVHFSDSNRAYPGGGAFDFKTMMRTLMEVGYNGYITNECQPYPDPYTCAKRGLDYCRHLQGLLEIERASLRNN